MSSRLLKDELKKYPFSLDKLPDPENIRFLDSIAKDFVMHSEVSGSRELVFKIEKKFQAMNFEKNYPSLFLQYQPPLAKLKFACLHALPEDEILSFIRFHLIEFIGNYWIDIFRRTREYLISMPRITRDEFKKKLIKAVEHNKEFIGRDKIKSEGKMVQPTLGSWLANYKAALGAQYHDEIERNHFLGSSEDFNKLSEKEKNSFRDALLFYETLKIPSDNPEALDVPSPEIFKRYDEFPGEQAGSESLIAYRREDAPKPKTILEAHPHDLPPPKSAYKKRELDLEKMEAVRPLPPPPPARSEPAKPAPSPPPVPAPEPKPGPRAPRKEVKATGHNLPRMDMAPAPSAPKPQAPRPKPMPLNKLDDIQNISVAGLRSSDQDAHESASNIVSRIGNLTAKNPMDRMKAKNLWKDSGLHKLYMEIGKESMKQEKSVQDIAKGRAAKGLPYLSEKEFEAVAEIGSKI